MPPPIAFRPKHACLNYPICKKPQLHTRDTDKTRVRLPHCKTCHSSSQTCAHPNCVDKPPPPRRNEPAPCLCAEHYRDPCHAQNRTWALCSNATIACRHLSMEPSRGKCYACANNMLPCVNAPLGCPHHVRYASKPASRLLQPCTTHASTLCPYDPTKKSSCKTPHCGNARAPLALAGAWR